MLRTVNENSKRIFCYTMIYMVTTKTGASTICKRAVYEMMIEQNMYIHFVQFRFKGKSLAKQDRSAYALKERFYV